MCCHLVGCCAPSVGQVLYSSWLLCHEPVQLAVLIGTFDGRHLRRFVSAAWKRESDDMVVLLLLPLLRWLQVTCGS
jgi:hypothetical protein